MDTKNKAAVQLGKQSAKVRKKKLGNSFNQTMRDLVKKRWEHKHEWEDYPDARDANQNPLPYRKCKTCPEVEPL